MALAFTAMPLPTFLLIYVPVLLNVTFPTSPATRPASAPPLMVALVVPSYTLLPALAPVRLICLGVITSPPSI